MAEAQAALERIAQASRQERKQALKQATAQHVESERPSWRPPWSAIRRARNWRAWAWSWPPARRRSSGFGAKRRPRRQRAERADERAATATRSREAAERQIAEATVKLDGMSRRRAQVQQEDLAARRAEKAALRRTPRQRRGDLPRAWRKSGANSSRVPRRSRRSSRYRRPNSKNCCGKTKSSSSRSNRCAPRGSAWKRARRELEQEWNQAQARTRRSGRRAAHGAPDSSPICAKSAAGTKSNARATTPSANTCAIACVNELNAQPEDLIAEQPALLSGEELRCRRRAVSRAEIAHRIHGPDQHDGARGIQRVRAALRLPGPRARGPAAIDHRYAAGHHRTRPGLAAEIRGSLRRHQHAFRHGLPDALRRRHRPDAPVRTGQRGRRRASTSPRSRRASACRTCCCFPAAKKR